MRWRISDAKLSEQKSNAYREPSSSDPEHVANMNYFNTPPIHEIPGHRPGVAFSDPQINPELQKIHRGTLSESVQFNQGHMTGYRPVGQFSASSRPRESSLQDQQDMPAGYGDEYYR
ncbi:hypothetical protein [Streptomyces sp. NPDC059411]|uniref:hypothetical protein n=1 Tax=Streptomyces sp. NPDC059411 TaxID=3346825 RepID=UPI003699A0DC